MIELPVVGFHRPAQTDALCICEVCGEEFTHRTRARDSNRCCSRTCGFKLLKAERIVARDARFLVLNAERMAARRHECLCCGKAFEASPIAKYCSAQCSSQAHHGAKARPRQPRNCAECDQEFTPTYGDKRRSYCSIKCSRRHSRRVSKGLARAAEFGVEAEAVNPLAIMERDGWHCHICGGHAPRELRGTFAADAPEIDHIIPLSRGGKHTSDNVACAHRQCNIEKGDGLGPDDGPRQRRWVHQRRTSCKGKPGPRIRRP